MIEGKDREDTIRLTAAAYGISLIDAAEIVLISLGESDGDDIVTDEDGNVIKQVHRSIDDDELPRRIVPPTKEKEKK